MTERVHMLGGQLSAGPEDDHWCVHDHVPLAPANALHKPTAVPAS